MDIVCYLETTSDSQIEEDGQDFHHLPTGTGNQYSAKNMHPNYSLSGQYSRKELPREKEGRPDLKAENESIIARGLFSQEAGEEPPAECCFCTLRHICAWYRWRPIWKPRLHLISPTFFARHVIHLFEDRNSFRARGVGLQGRINDIGQILEPPMGL